MFAGLHIRANDRYQSTLVLINEDLKATTIHTFNTDQEFHNLIKQISPSIIAIGSPTSLPLGLCCLEIDCNCNYTIEGHKGRISEIQMASMSISCFYTTRGSISKNLIYRSINISNELHSEGYHVIETYPHATKSILFGEYPTPTKQLMSPNTDSSTIYPFLTKQGDFSKWDKNTYNAALSAYTAGLYNAELTDSLGTKEEGFVVVPALR